MSTSSMGDAIIQSTNSSIRSHPPCCITSLPQDIIFQVLEQLFPSDIAQYAQLNRQSSFIASHSSLWLNVAKKRLAILPNQYQSFNSTILHQLAQQLSCHWWLVTGVLVPGVPVHRRTGFLNILPRGGCPVPLNKDDPETCYVFGGKYADRSIPVHHPCLIAEFSIDPSGPFPVDGMILRLIHAVEPNQDDSQDQSIISTKSFVNISVKINNNIIAQHICPQGSDFNVTEIPISSNLLYKKPRMNTVSVEYDRNSTMGYWLREIRLVPKILPLPPIDPQSLKFKSPIVNTPPSPPSIEESIDEEEEEETNSSSTNQDRSQRNDDSHARRPTRRRSTDFVSKRFLGEVQNMTRYQNKAKHLKAIKMPKHLYHHNHYRSPRGFAPGSPGKTRSGR